jgi:sucrose-6-phosphate hydrolase SacC (GH32 family)
MNSIEFETELFDQRAQHYRQRSVDVIRDGFRPVGGKLGDFCVVEHHGHYHFFAIERRLVEGTPFYPGHELFFCHLSTADYANWQVHDPVLLVRPDTWEEAHVWAPFILPWQGQYVMAYTGVNRYGSQDIGFASSTDLFEWQRWPTNPLSPARNRAWAFWRTDGIASCRDPHLLVHTDRIFMTYTTNTAAGASCIALMTSADFEHWEDLGPILIGPEQGYEPRLQGGHPQGQLESSNLLYMGGRWLLLVQGRRRGSDITNWIYESETMHSFAFDAGREFWPGGYTVEVVQMKGTEALLATLAGTGSIHLGAVNWSDQHPTAHFLQTYEQVSRYLRWADG